MTRNQAKQNLQSAKEGGLCLSGIVRGAHTCRNALPQEKWRSADISEAKRSKNNEADWRAPGHLFPLIGRISRSAGLSRRPSRHSCQKKVRSGLLASWTLSQPRQTDTAPHLPDSPSPTFVEVTAGVPEPDRELLEKRLHTASLQVLRNYSAL